MPVITFRVSRRITFVFILWVIGEVLAFAIVARVIGVAGAILLGLAASLAGFALLKRAGSSAMMKLRAVLAGRGPAPNEDAAADVADDLLSAAGAIALLVPGFLSDIVGLTLVLPALRRRLARWAVPGVLSKLRRRGDGQTSTIDLDPDEWRRTDPAGRPVIKR